ncbi:hypothetical protein [Spiroplasma endosymbiont of Polydrusus pterygomalis]|uniref:hypothetical protein n=1 Tax=Spiroplasma endosymbiont of Polydrusus pterygomalis TaxID=3139327 RepID=UPI003CCB130F
MQKVTTDKEFYKIRKKIDKIDNQMIKIWDGKKVEKIYEEILPIEDKIFFITTFIHANQSISEETIFLHDFGNNNFKVVKQTKHYQHIKEYTKNLLLIDKENKEEVFKFTPIKNLLKEHNDLKLKPTKKEKLIWVTSVLLPTIALIIGVFHPPILILGVIGLLFKLGTSFVSPSIKKVESWWYNKKFKNQAKNEREKRERESIIKDLTSDKKEIRLKMQFKILKQEVDNRKVKNSDELISCKTINNNFDLFIRNTVNQQELPSPATKIHHSNSIS